ncbi:hypothetical protein ACS0TY_004858 [Phlomoides rotata]
MWPLELHGTISAKGAYRAAQQHFPEVSWDKWIKGSFIPMKRSTILWRVIHGRLPTWDFLRRRGFAGRYEEDLDHIWCQCPWARVIFDKISSVFYVHLIYDFGFHHWLLQAMAKTFSPQILSIWGLVVDMLLGGTDTAVTTLEWVMTELLRNPMMMKKLQSEVKGIMNGKQEDIMDEDLEKMQYLKAVVKETLRYHTPIPFLAREAREDAKIMGYDIAAGTFVIINTWAIGRDLASWDEPDKFQPERFLSSSTDFKGLDFEFIPFGAGRRRCPGISFAMASVELVLANLVHKFEWGLPNGMKWEDLDCEEDPGATIHRRKNPLLAVPKRCHF